MSEILAHLPPLSRTAVLDILLVAFLIYGVLRLVRGTRASLMLLGLAGLALAMQFIRSGELRTTNWLITKLLPYAGFVLIVLFQAEIRQALARLGRMLAFSRALSPEADAYDDIVLAAQQFSKNKTGALIVVEREVGLRTFTESGVALDARLSYDLLATIFRPKTPLHDGAVIVQRDRIAAAACFLPLSMDPILSTQLGTRHRAGIGITEETDAIAIIVSEETGGISLAVSGKIERDISADILRARLSRLLRTFVPPSTLPTLAPAAEPTTQQVSHGEVRSTEVRSTDAHPREVQP